MTGLLLSSLSQPIETVLINTIGNGNVRAIPINHIRDLIKG